MYSNPVERTPTFTLRIKFNYETLHLRIFIQQTLEKIVQPTGTTGVGGGFIPTREKGGFSQHAYRQLLSFFGIAV